MGDILCLKYYLSKIHIYAENRVYGEKDRINRRVMSDWLCVDQQEENNNFAENIGIFT